MTDAEETTGQASAAAGLDVQLAAELIERAKAQGVSLVGPDGLLAGITKTVLQAALDAEMTEHLGYEKGERPGQPGGNHRNGRSSKTVLTVKQETQTLLIDRPPGKPGTAQIVKHATDDDEGGLADDTTYAIASWHAPSGRWYMVAGGTPAIVRMRAWGKHDKNVDGNTLTIRGPKNHKLYEPEWHTSVDAETKSGEPGSLP